MLKKKNMPKSHRSGYEAEVGADATVPLPQSISETADAEASTSVFDDGMPNIPATRNLKRPVGWQPLHEDD